MNKNIFYWVGYGYTALTIVAFLTFTALKLTSVIDWSWWVVSLPIWGSFIAALALVGVLYLIFSKTIQKNEK